MEAHSISDDELPGMWSLTDGSSGPTFVHPSRNLRANFSAGTSGLFVIRQEISVDDITTDLVRFEDHLSGIEDIPGALSAISEAGDYVPLLTIDTEVQGMIDVVCATNGSITESGIGESLAEDLMNHAYGEDVDFDSYDKVGVAEDVANELDRLELHVFPMVKDSVTESVADEQNV